MKNAWNPRFFTDVRIPDAIKSFLTYLNFERTTVYAHTNVVNQQLSTLPWCKALLIVLALNLTLVIVTKRGLLISPVPYYQLRM